MKALYLNYHEMLTLLGLIGESNREDKDAPTVLKIEGKLHQLLAEARAEGLVAP